MATIGIDASALTLPHPTGVQRYTEYIIKNLLLVGKDHTFRLYSPRPLPEPFTPYQVVITSPRFWTQIRLPIELYLHRPDVFFQPGYMLPPISFCPSVVTVHDVGWLKYPRAYSQQQLKLEDIAINRLEAKHSVVIVPSLSAKKDCRKLLGLQNQIEVIPEALVELPPPNLPNFPNIQKLKTRPIILAVGRLEERKNTATLVKAIEILSLTPTLSQRRGGSQENTLSNPSPVGEGGRRPDEGNKPLLVLLGQAGYGAEKIFAAISHAKQNGAEIIHIKEADDEQLATWLSVAKVLAYPSLYEGFGLPILQAFKAGVPVVASKVSSIPEVGGDAVMYINNPHSEDELAAALYAILNDPNKSEKLVRAGADQLKKFSWEAAAGRTLELLVNSTNIPN